MARMSLLAKLIAIIVVFGHVKSNVVEENFKNQIKFAVAKRVYGRLMKALDEARNFCKIKTMCYDKLGCFDNKKPYDNVLCQVPEDPADLGTKFLLYTRQDQLTPEEIHYSSERSVTRSSYDPTRKTKFLMHGFTENGHLAWVKSIVKETLQKETVNFVVVDWERGARLPNYFQAVANCRIVGAEIALLVSKLGEWKGLQNSNVTLIGFSLGAQVAGYAGERLPGLSKIIGLDPAGPLFEGEDTKVRLDPTDAENVAVLHTNGGVLTLGYLGYLPECGHVDFYPNGGSIQPGCGSPTESALDATASLFGLSYTVDVLYGEMDLRTNLLDQAKEIFAKLYHVFDRAACNHRRAVYLYSKALRHGITGFGCDSYESFSHGRCDKVGIASLENSEYRGSAYLHTLNKHSGYIGTHFRVKITVGSEEPRGEINATLTFSSGEAQAIRLTKNEKVNSSSSTSVVMVTQYHLVKENIKKVDIHYQKGFSLWPWVHNSLDVVEVDVLNYDSRKSWRNCENKNIPSGATKLFLMKSENCRS